MITITAWIQQGPYGWRGYASDRGLCWRFATSGGTKEDAIAEAKAAAAEQASRYIGDWTITTEGPES